MSVVTGESQILAPFTGLSAKR